MSVGSKLPRRITRTAGLEVESCSVVSVCILPQKDSEHNADGEVVAIGASRTAIPLLSQLGGGAVEHRNRWNGSLSQRPKGLEASCEIGDCASNMVGPSAAAGTTAHDSPHRVYVGWPGLITRRSDQLGAGCGAHELPVLHSPRAYEAVCDTADFRRITHHHDGLQAVVVVEVHVL